MVETKVINTESYETLQQEVTELNRVLVIGLGQLGLPVAKYIKQRGGFDVYGYDISSKAMDRAQTTAGIKKATNFSDFDVYILCISTHKPEDMFSPQIEGLLSIIDKISKEAKNGALVSIESTIPRGTSKKVFEMLNHRLHVAHIPHRWYALEEKEHGVNQLRVVGGVCDCCLKVAMQFYGQVNDNDKMNNNNVNNINSNNHRIDNNITISGNNEVDEVDEEYKRYRLSRGIDIAKAVPSYINSGA